MNNCDVQSKLCNNIASYNVNLKQWTALLSLLFSIVDFLTFSSHFYNHQIELFIVKLVSLPLHFCDHQIKLFFRKTSLFAPIP